jgi:dihydroorotase
LGSDSAPHPKDTKECAIAHAGVFTTPYLAQYLAHALDDFGALDQLEDFACVFGPKFYGLDVAALNQGRTVTLTRDPANPTVIPAEIEYMEQKEGAAVGELVRKTVVPFLAGKSIPWSIQK